MSERVSQDPLENFFGCQRQRGGANENPNVAQFCKNTQALRVINSVCGTVSKSNSRGNKKTIDLQAESKPMPKRRKAKKKVPFPPTSESVPLSAAIISESAADVPDLPATAIGDEYPAALLHVSKSENHDQLPSSFLVETNSNINIISEDIKSPDMSPFTSDEEEVPLTNQHLPTANYSSHCQERVLSELTRANCTDSETESASDSELPGVLGTVEMRSDSDMELSEDNDSSNDLPETSAAGVLDTVVMGSSDSDMELSEDNDSSNYLPEISTVSENRDELTDCVFNDNLALHSTASEDMTDSRPTSIIVRPKTLAEEDRVSSALATGLAGEKIVRLFNITLTRQDFWTLKSMEWLNDQVIFRILFKCSYVHIYYL